MFRQLSNLKHLGRLRTNAATPRASKPKLLKRHPELEIPNLLEFVVAHHGRPHSEFFFVQIGAFDGRVADPLYQLVHRHHWRGVLVEPQQPERTAQAERKVTRSAPQQAPLKSCDAPRPAAPCPDIPLSLGRA